MFLFCFFVTVFVMGSGRLGFLGIGIWPCLSLAVVWVIVQCLDLSGCGPAEWCVLFSFDHFIYVGMGCRKRFQVSWHKCQSEKVLWVLQVVLGWQGLLSQWEEE